MNSLLNKTVKVIDLGLVDYKQAWDYQTELFNQTLAIKASNRDRSDSDQISTPNYLILCEHPHVYTLGKSGKEQHLLLPESQLSNINATYYPINRGGDITYHGPGQLVVYPVLDLDNFFTDIHKYMRLLEESVIQTLAKYGIESTRIPGLTGVWLDEKRNPRKICAFGVKTSRWVTMHGLALNVNTDLSYFSHIVACGIQDKGVTSMQKELGHEVKMEEIKAIMAERLIHLFEMNRELQTQ